LKKVKLAGNLQQKKDVTTGGDFKNNYFDKK
jgi:hypothetical protein